jgi:hypothetical protein
LGEVISFTAVDDASTVTNTTSGITFYSTTRLSDFTAWAAFMDYSGYPSEIAYRFISNSNIFVDNNDNSFSLDGGVEPILHGAFTSATECEGTTVNKGTTINWKAAPD